MKRPHDEAFATDDDHGDSLFVEEDTDKISPYDAKKESLPDCKVYTDEYKAIEDEKTKISSLLEAPFLDTIFRSGPTDGLLDDLKRRLKDSTSEKIKIGVVGNMSSGKSSVINSLLSLGTIARQGDAGSSCTWVVNEFCSLLPNQTKSFAAEIHFFTQEQRHDIIKSLVADYYRASAKDQEASDGSKDPDQTSEDISTMQGVVTAFRALFNAQLDFQTTEKAHEYLSQAESEDDAEIIDHLCGLADGLVTKTLRGNGTCVRVEDDTPQSLLLNIECYQHTVEEHCGEPMVSPWPLVSRIKFGVDCPLLEHVTLVDLPGLSDANKTRVANATAQLRKCTHNMVIAHIGRATDDKTIRQHLSRGFASRGSGRSMLVLTHADSLDPSSELQITPKVQQALDELAAKKEELNMKKSELSQKIKRMPKGVQKYETMEARDEVARQIRNVDLEFQEIRIRMRSTHVIKAMESIYRELTPDPLPLKVFCVGNAAYKKHQAGYAQDDPNPPALSVEGTEIPALRKYLLRAPMDGRLNETRNQIIHQVPAMLTSCELYVAKSHMARKDEIGRIVLEPQYMVGSVVDSAFNELKIAVDNEILHQFRLDEFEWTTEASKLCSKWALNEKTAAHLALLKKDGVRKETRRAKGANWNSDLVSINAAEIRQWFGHFMPSVEEAQKEIIKEVNAMVTKMSRTISSDPQVALMALKPFLNYAYAEKGTIQQRAREPIRRLRREIGNILRSAITDELANPIVRAMTPVYDEARKIKGASPKGSKVKVPAPKRRIDYFNAAVTRQGDGVWMSAHDLLKSDIHGVLDTYAEELKDIMLKFFVNLHGRFDMMCAESGPEDEREVELREKLSKKTLEARDVYEKELLPAAKKFFEN